MKRKSIVLTALIPAAEMNADIFKSVSESLFARGISTIEYCTAKEQAVEKGAFLKALGANSVYLGASAQKRGKSSLCAPDAQARSQALELAKRQIDIGIEAGASSVLLTSGWRVEEAERIAAWDALEASCRELLELAAGHIELTLEPGDTGVEFCQLLGSTEDALAFINRFEKSESAPKLTMDMSHCAQLGEDPLAAITAVKDHCRHIHLANCVLQKNNPLYGDKHPVFDYPEGEFSKADAISLESELEKLFAGKDYTLGVEIINRFDDQQAGMDAILASLSWFLR